MQSKSTIDMNCVINRVHMNLQLPRLASLKLSATNTHRKNKLNLHFFSKECTRQICHYFFVGIWLMFFPFITNRNMKLLSR
jgi:hypothetical protein